MSHAASFDDALHAVEQLPPDDQAELIEIVRRRLVELNRQRLANEAREAREEFAAGQLRPASADDSLSTENVPEPR